MEAPRTLQAAIIHFKEYENCKTFMTKLRWPDGIVRCPYCDSDNVTYLDKARVWKCYGKHDRPRFSLKTGTIFEDSPISLDKWLTAVWLVVNCKNGISSYEVHRDLGVTQKSTWFMMHRIRYALHTGSFAKLSGHIEVDETFIGGKARNMHKNRKRRVQMEGRNLGGKAIVIGMLERKGMVRASVVPERTRKVMQEHVRAHIEKGTQIHSDQAAEFWRMDDEYVHNVINHLEGYVQGNVHTNTLENFWSLLKRGINGTYVSVEPFHLFRYVDEQAFRYNTRKHRDGEVVTDAERFSTAVSQIVGKRLTYAELTGKVGEKPALN
jgi:transposase-like protein